MLYWICEMKELYRASLNVLALRDKHRTGFIQIIVINFSLLKSASSYLHSPLVLDIREKKVVNQQYLSTLS